MKAGFSGNFYGSALPEHLSNMVFLFDLDGTITEPEERRDVKFVPGAIDFMVKLHKQGARIAIISHSCNKTIYSEAVLNKLAEMGITDIPYVSLYDVVIKALQTAETDYDEQGKKFITLNPGEGVKLKIECSSFGTRADRIAVLGNQGNLIKVFGKGISHMMGSVALEKLGLTEKKCREISICTVGDSITDIMHARILQEKYGFRQAFGFLLNAIPEKQLFQDYFTNLLYPGSMSELMVFTAREMIKLRCEGVSLVQWGHIPNHFSPIKWYQLSNGSKEVAAQTGLEIKNAYAKESVLAEEIEARASLVAEEVGLRTSLEIEARASLVAEEVGVRTSLESQAIATRNTPSTRGAGDEAQTVLAESQATFMSRLSSWGARDGSRSSSLSSRFSNQGTQRNFARARTPILTSDSCDGSGSTSASLGSDLSVKPKPRRRRTPIPLHRRDNWTSGVTEQRQSAIGEQGQNCGSSTNI